MGQISIGAIPTIAPYLLPLLVSRFAQRFPRAQVTVHEDLTEHTLQGCLEGKLDVGILALPVEHPNLAVEPLFTEELLLVTAANHPLAKKKRVTMGDIAKQPFVLLSQMHCLGEQVVSFCRQKECLPAVTCESAQLLTVQEFVASGHGVSLIPEMAAAVDKDKRRSHRSLSGDKPNRTVAMIWHKQRYQSPLVAEFMKLLRERNAPR